MLTQQNVNGTTNMPVNSDNSLQLNPEILGGIENTLRLYLERRCKAYCIMLTLTYPGTMTYPRDNNLFRRFLHRFRLFSNRRYLDLIYLWATEAGMNSSSGNLHHHVIAITNGSVTQQPHRHLNLAKHIWAYMLGLQDAEGLVHCSKNDDGSYGHFIRRGDEAAFQQAYSRFAYLAKLDTKEELPAGVRQWGRCYSLYTQSACLD